MSLTPRAANWGDKARKPCPIARTWAVAITCGAHLETLAQLRQRNAERARLRLFMEQAPRRLEPIVRHFVLELLDEISLALGIEVDLWQRPEIYHRFDSEVARTVDADRIPTRLRRLEIVSGDSASASFPSNSMLDRDGYTLRDADGELCFAQTEADVARLQKAEFDRRLYVLAALQRGGRP